MSGRSGHRQHGETAIGETRFRPDFPAPIDTLTVGRIWDAADVPAYAKLRGQRLADSEGD